MFKGFSSIFFSPKTPLKRGVMIDVSLFSLKNYREMQRDVSYINSTINHMRNIPYYGYTTDIEIDKLWMKHRQKYPYAYLEKLCRTHDNLPNILAKTKDITGLDRLIEKNARIVKLVQMKKENICISVNGRKISRGDLLFAKTLLELHGLSNTDIPIVDDGTSCFTALDVSKAAACLNVSKQHLLYCTADDGFYGDHASGGYLIDQNGDRLTRTKAELMIKDSDLCKIEEFLAIEDATNDVLLRTHDRLY